MNVCSGVVATVLMIAAFQITGANSSRYFEAVLGLTISTTTISYLFIFPALVKLRYSRPDVKRPYRVPGGMAGAWICTVLPTLWALVATVFLLWPGLGVNWFGAGGNPNNSLGCQSCRVRMALAELRLPSRTVAAGAAGAAATPGAEAGRHGE
jgi:glutamate:GABA antiporter